MAKRNTTSLLIFIFAMFYFVQGSANNFFIKLEYGIILIVTSKTEFDDAVDITFSTISFFDDVLLQLVTNAFDDPLHIDFLAEELILFYLHNSLNIPNLIEPGGHNHQIENDFYNTNLWSNNISEYHLAGSVIFIDDSLMSSAHNSPENFFTPIPIEGEQLLCMLGCGMSFIVSAKRANHHRRKHKKEYKELHEMCKKPFNCKFCGCEIVSFKSLSFHVHKCPIAKDYTDYMK